MFGKIEHLRDLISKKFDSLSRGARFIYNAKEL